MWCAAATISVSAALTVSTHWHSDGQTCALPAEAVCAEVGQLLSCSFTGETQQQNQRLVPQVRPSHCQEASASGEHTEKRSARRARRQ